jgi:hypothetical protein
MFEDLHQELLGIVMEFVDVQSLDELVGDPRIDPGAEKLSTSGTDSRGLRMELWR